MKTARTIALLLCISIVSAFFSPALAVGGQSSDTLAQYASELSQYTGLKYFRGDDTERYIGYKTIHPDLDWETVITYVNIGLDQYFYTNASPVANPGDIWVLINKYRTLPPDFVPSQLENINPLYSVGKHKLTHAARLAFEKMCADAKKLGYSLFATSGYRSFNRQQGVFDSFYDPGNPDTAVAQELSAARPGYSEHQTGLAVDVIRANPDLENTAVYKWYVKNAHKYGFIIRYPYGKEPVLGYTYEPWHLRYLGVKLATAVYNSGLTYDEYYMRELDIPAKTTDIRAVGVTGTCNVTAGMTKAQLSVFDILGARYYRLRDIAALLNGTPAQFDITWDAAANRIVILYGSPYTGDPSPAVFAPGHAALVTAAKAGFEAGDTAFDLTAYMSDGSAYFRMEDMEQMLGITAVDDGQDGFFLDTAARSPAPKPGESPSPADSEASTPVPAGSAY